MDLISKIILLSIALLILTYGKCRYYRNTNAKPIWPISSGRPSKADIPKCSYCVGPRCCEFQVVV